jgi:ribosomal protein S18 acetylase RimI-like enzyme
LPLADGIAPVGPDERGRFVLTRLGDAVGWDIVCTASLWWLTVVSLQPLAPEELSDWLAVTREEYMSQRVASGGDPSTSALMADERLARLFPGGQPASGQHVYRIMRDHDQVGSIWIGEGPDGPSESWWVWSIEVDEIARGRGFGREAMVLAEGEARRYGATRMGLNVFGSNHVARALYERLGYETTAVQMQKFL